MVEPVQGVVEGLLGDRASLCVMLLRFILEDRVVQRQPEADRMGWRELRASEDRCLLVRRGGLVRIRLLVARDCKLGQVCAGPAPGKEGKEGQKGVSGSVQERVLVAPG